MLICPFISLGMVEKADMRYLFIDPPGNPGWKADGTKGSKIPIEDQYPGKGLTIADGSWDIDTCYDGGKCDLEYTW
eukprot:CAMPEP_0113708540 /NCGR_PEP_ID=MMETSP0038_2-20120614/29042_1 /TAXON_ID=2898 /ORGANISM="Cryptomonas paramecium" /LENGTH=75 /DNA_ID=CAMNT_0000634265 /DNA_START=6 /DNA_END=230 /DNA_ORIENTATION=- /assembly_acc=CAM_ASM_000170